MATTEKHPEFERLLIFLKKLRGFDFTAYKRSTLMRRVQKRMLLRGCNSFEEYQGYLENHPDEFPQLFNTILINVTSFFRDGDAWDYFCANALPKIAAERHPDEPIRAWVAGCATGEEAYTLAMVLSEIVGPDEFKDRVKIYATDLDEEALDQARAACYTLSDVQNVPPSLIEQYFEANGDRYTFSRELRRTIVFGKHDLLSDAPISRVDLLLCRNTLMYFNAEAQERILSKFHFALNSGGVLYLGKAETLLTHANMFAPLDLKHRVFAKHVGGRLKDRSFMIPEGSIPKSELDIPFRLREASFNSSPVPQITVDAGGRLVLVNDRARQMFNLSKADLGKMFHDLEISYRPVELRSGIEQAYDHRRPVTYKEVRLNTTSGDMFVLDVKIVPLTGAAAELLGCSIFFEDITQFKRLHEDLENFNQELETAYEELQSTNEELQTTNEELQSTVEELETTNEELQSTNEELETINEELHSTNEELETINDELKLRSDELNQSNSFLEAILAGLHDGVIVVNQDLKILAWNAKCEDMWGLRADEVKGKHLLNLDVGLPLEELKQALRVCMGTEELAQIRVMAINRRGRQVEIRATTTPLSKVVGAEPGAIIMLEESPPPTSP